METFQATQPSRFCRTCGYALAGLSENRCPECGRRFDPHDPRTFLRHPRGWSARRWARRLGWTAGILAIAAALYAAGLWCYLRYCYYRSQQAELPHIAALRQAGCGVTTSVVHGWADELAEPFGWQYMMDCAYSVKQMPPLQRPLTVADLEHLGRLTHLYGLQLYLDHIETSGLVHIAALKNLGDVFLCGYGPAARIDAEMEHLADLVNVQSLVLMNTDLTDEGLRYLRGMTNVSNLSLGHTRITDAGLEHLKGLKNLRDLDLSGTHVTRQGVKSLGRALPATRIRWSEGRPGRSPPGD